MIIDQLNATVTDNLTDELAVEQGTLTYKTTWQKILALFKSNTTAADIATTNGNVQTDIGDMALTTTATDLTDAINELDSDKQDTLVSGTNIKTINSTTLLGSGNISLGASFTVTLSSASWSSNTQTVSNANFATSGYAYVISPASGSYSDYASAQIYADDVSTDGQMTFHCAEEPSSNLTVNVVRVGTA